MLTGTVHVPDGDPPPELVVAVNGVLAGVVGGYQTSPGRGDWDFATILAPFFRDGSNTLRAYEVDGTATEPVLHALR